LGAFSLFLFLAYILYLYLNAVGADCKNMKYIKVKRLLKTTDLSKKKYGYDRIPIEYIINWRVYSDNSDQELITISLKKGHPLGVHVVCVKPTVSELDEILKPYYNE